MDIERYFSVSDFAKLSRTTKNTLRYYDTIGILKPVMRAENNYRYYSTDQLSVVNMVRILQDLGMTLDEIIKTKEQRNPEFMEALYIEQIKKIDQKIDEWVIARKLLLTLQETLHSVTDIDRNAITIEFLPAAAIVLGKLNDYSRNRNDYNALLDFYQAISEQYPDMNLNYPVWACFSEARLRSGDLQWPDRYYFHNPEGHDRRPAAQYAVGYTQGGYGQTETLYHRIFDYINQNGYEICGNAYEEYPLNELAVSDPSGYLIRVLVTVRKKK